MIDERQGLLPLAWVLYLIAQVSSRESRAGGACSSNQAKKRSALSCQAFAALMYTGQHYMCVSKTNGGDACAHQPFAVRGVQGECIDLAGAVAPALCSILREPVPLPALAQHLLHSVCQLQHMHEICLQLAPGLQLQSAVRIWQNKIAATP